MYYELYLDVLFLMNFLMDYILLLTVKKLIHIPSSYGRIALGAVMGSTLTCVCVAVSIPVSVLRFAVYYGAIPSGMLLATFHIRSVHIFARAMITLYIGGILIGGIFQCLDQYVQVGSLFFGVAIASYYLSAVVLWVLKELFHFGEIYCKVILFYQGLSLSAEAIVDTGNHLKDRASGKAVTIISHRLADRLFQGKLPEGIRYIPYHTIGKGNQAIAVVSIDMLCIEGGQEEWIEKPLIGISEQSSFEKEYDVILSSEIDS